MFEQLNLRGEWIRGENKGIVGLLADFRSGQLITTVDGAEAGGTPDDIYFPSKGSGRDVLLEILLPPSCEQLRYGMVRESIAAVYSVAQYGFSETRAWDGKKDYIVDNGEGSACVVRFENGSCFGALASSDPHRDFSAEMALHHAPQFVQKLAAGVMDLPFLKYSSTPVTSVFWATDGQLTSVDDWPTVYEFGGEVLRGELLADMPWVREAKSFYGMEGQVPLRVIELAKRRWLQDGPIEILEEFYCELIPSGSPYSADAQKLLVDLDVHVKLF